jgi:hypothetical protein
LGIAKARDHDLAGDGLLVVEALDVAEPIDLDLEPDVVGFAPRILVDEQGVLALGHPATVGIEDVFNRLARPRAASVHIDIQHAAGVNRLPAVEGNFTPVAQVLVSGLVHMEVEVVVVDRTWPRSL